MKYFFVVMFVCLSAASLSAGEGGLDSELTARLRNSYQPAGSERALYNAITNNDMKSLALNRDLIRDHREVFSHKIKAKGITNQKSSGRCWLFAGLNIMRPAVLKEHKLDEFELSQNYLAFWDKMEKANFFLEKMIEYADRDPLDREMEILLRGPIGDGGWWKYVVDLVAKYGVVPSKVMPETNSSSKTGMMNKLIARQLRADAVILRAAHQDGQSLGDLRKTKEKMLAVVYRMLVLNLGEPPTEFEYRFEDKDSVVSEAITYTPQSFYKDFIGVDLSEYVNLFNDPTKEYGRHYRMLLSRNIYDSENVNFANLEIEQLKQLAMKAVLDDEPVWFACDVGKDQDKEHGIMAVDIYDYNTVYQTDMSLTKAERSLYRESAPNHAMVFIGVDVKNDKPVKWLVENSWGDEKGSDGYWTLYDTWFDEHVYNVIIRKKYVPDDILKIFDQDPVELPAWDPMYQRF